MIANGNKTTGAAAFLKSRPGLPGILGDGVEKSMLSLGDQLVVSATGFLSGVIVARYCSLAELGAYHLAISVLLILRGIQAELVTSPFAIYSYRRSDEQLDTYTGSVLVHQTVCILAAFLLLCALCLATLQGLTPTAFRAVMPALLFAGPMVLIREYCRQHSFARLQFDVAVVTDLSVLAIQLVGLYWVATASELTVSLAFWIIGAACGIACFTWWSASRPRFRVEPRQVISDWRQNWSFGRWALTSYLVCSTTPALMTWIVAWLRSEEEAGKLAACVTLIGLSNLFTTAIANFLTPKTAAVYATEGIIGLRRVCGKVTLLFGMVLGCFSALVFITGDWLGTIVYGSAFFDVGFLCGIVALGLLANSFTIVAGNALWAIDRPRANLRADVTTAVVTLSVALYLIPTKGMLGAAVSLLVGSTTGALVRWATVFQSWRRLTIDS